MWLLVRSFWDDLFQILQESKSSSSYALRHSISLERMLIESTLDPSSLMPVYMYLPTDHSLPLPSRLDTPKATQILLKMQNFSLK